MQFSAAQISSIINGRVEGDPSASVSSFSKIEEASAGQLAFLANPKYEEYLYTTGATIIIVNDHLELKSAIKSTLIRVPDAYSAFARLLSAYQDIVSLQLSVIEQPSQISPTASLGERVYVGAFVYIADQVTIGNDTKIHPQAYLGRNVRVGNNTVIHPGVKIYHDCVIGDHVIIHAGTVIGSDGFGFAPQADGSYSKVPQIGNVVVEDHVEIGANTCIDRATMGSTIIRQGSKLDNLIQIAHNVEVGCKNVIAAQAGISGSTKIGDHVQIGGQAGIAGHITIAEGTRVGGQSGVTKAIKTPNTALNGTPAFDYKTSLRIQALVRQLPEMERRMQEIERLVQQLRHANI
jgi:UDP-3-O-[3-hydroxymyristoyl] glucosamine N-acyltransferase